MQDRADRDVKPCQHDGLIRVKVNIVWKLMQPPDRKFGVELG